jgi:hypothetical protein
MNPAGFIKNTWISFLVLVISLITFSFFTNSFWGNPSERDVEKYQKTENHHTENAFVPMCFFLAFALVLFSVDSLK